MKKILLLFPVLFCVIFYAYGDEMVEATLPEEVRTVAPAEKRSPKLSRMPAVLRLMPMRTGSTWRP